MTDMLSGGYNTQGKVSPRNRKREKAHVKMRDRMRRKMYGSSVLQTRLQNPASNTSRSLPAAITTIADQETYPKKSLLNRDGYWRTQQERYDTMLHTGNPTIGGNRDNESIQSLMNRVMEKKRQTQPIQNNSLLTIRSYRRPTAPYAIQQQSLIKKMVGIAPLPRGKPEKKGPYVLVLQTRKNKKSLKEPKNTKDLRPVVLPSDDQVSSETTLSSLESKPEIKPLPQISKWKPNLNNIPKPPSPVESDDRAVTNYKLQLQHANRLAESRSHLPSHSTERQTLQKYSALPSISKIANEPSEPTVTEVNSDTSHREGNYEQEGAHLDKDTIPRTKETFRSRKSNSSDILEVMEAKKQAKRGKHAETDFKTLLRTRHRYTSDTRMFKDDLVNMRRLSIISEGNSATSESQGRVSSAERTSSRASIASLKSVPSLEKIDETKVVKEGVGERAMLPTVKSPGAIYLIQEETMDPNLNGSDHLCAPPSTPVSRSEDADMKKTTEGERGIIDENCNSSNHDRLHGMRWISGDDEFVKVK